MSTRSSPASSGTTEPRAEAFAPVVGPDTRVLIVGSLPGRASLARAEYYGHPRNGFWRLVGAAIGTDLVKLAYPDRLAALRAAGIGLADAIASAERRGSLDAAIRAAEAYDLAALVGQLPAVRAIAFNGRTASRIGRAMLGTAPVSALIDLPSSSPAHAAMREADKLAAWSAIAPYLAPRPG